VGQAALWFHVTGHPQERDEENWNAARVFRAIGFAQIVVTDPPVPLQHYEIDHIHEFGPIRSKFIAI
jgi:hypothetical protein